VQNEKELQIKDLEFQKKKYVDLDIKHQKLVQQFQELQQQYDTLSTKGKQLHENFSKQQKEFTQLKNDHTQIVKQKEELHKEMYDYKAKLLKEYNDKFEKFKASIQDNKIKDMKTINETKLEYETKLLNITNE